MSLALGDNEAVHFEVTNPERHGHALKDGAQAEPGYWAGAG